MHKNQNQRKINSTISSGKTKIVYTQYYFWRSQNIVLLQRARVSPSFCVRKNSPDRSFSERLSQKKVFGRLSFFDLSDESRPIFCASHCRKKESAETLLSFFFLQFINGNLSLFRKLINTPHQRLCHITTIYRKDSTRNTS